MLRTLAGVGVLSLVAACGLDTQGQLETGATGGGNTSTGAGASTGIGAGGGGPEDCLNGTDDDGDGDVDCADSDCADHSCVPLVDNALSYAATGPSCPGATTPLELGTCEGCACDSNDGTCQVTADVYSDAGCNNLVTTTTSGTPSCFDVSPNVVGYVTTTLTPTGDGSCAPTAATVAPGTRQICELEQVGSCNGGSSVCVPPSVTAEPLCVLLDGDVACPGDYSEKTVHHIGAGDCSCSCSVASEQCTPGSIDVYSTQDNCTGADQSFPMGSCVSVGYSPSITIPAVNSTPTCGAQAVPPGGADVRTLCCAP